MEDVTKIVLADVTNETKKSDREASIEKAIKKLIARQF
jgi:hypothetical protein